MTTFVDCYQQKNFDFQARLKLARTNKELVEIVQQEIKKFADINGEYIGKLTPAQARIATDMLGSLNQRISILTAVKPQSSDLNVHHKPERSAKTTPFGEASAALVGAASATASATLIGGPLAIAFGTIIGVTAGVIVNYASDTDKTTTERTQPQEIEPNIDIQKLLSNLNQAFADIDRAVKAYIPDEPAKPSLKEHRDLLEYLQNLMADALDEQVEMPTQMRKRIEQAAMILRHYGIEAKDYHESEKQSFGIDPWSMFDFEPGIEPEIQEYVTLKHAFVKDGQVLLRGRVIEPTTRKASVN